jgi:hypothetical protein
MAVKSDYKFKPYTPVNLKMASPKDASLSQQEKTLKSLQAQKANLNARLAAEGIDPETLGGEFDNRNLIEKALNLRPNQGLLMDFFEVINRPVEAVKGALVSGAEGQNVLEGFWEGISGQETIAGSEFLKKTTGIDPQTGVGKFIADVGVDIALDPLTYLPAGFFLKGFKKIGGIGSKVVTKEITQAAIKSAAKEAGERVTKNVLQAAQELVDDVARADITDIDTAIVEVIRNRTTASSRDFHIIEGALDTMTVQDIAKGIQDGTLSQTILTKSGTDRFNLKERLVRMQQIKDGVYQPKLGKAGKPSPGELAEIRQYTKIYSKIEGLDPDNILVILNKGSDKYDDIGIYYKTKIGNKTVLSKVDNIEIKQMDEIVSKTGKKSGRAFFSNPTLNSTMDAATGKLTISFGSEATLSSASQDVIKTTLKNIKVAEKIDGQEFFLDELIALSSDAVKAGDSAKALKYRKIINKALKDPTNKEALTAMFSKIAQDSPIGFTFFETTIDGKGIMVDVTENIDKFEGFFDIMGKSKGQLETRFTMSFGLKDGVDVSEFVDQSENLISRFKDTPGSTRQVTEIWTLARRAREGEFGELAQKISKAYKNFEINFKLAFNLTGGLSPEVADLLKAAQGENLFELERRSARLAEIQQQLMKVDPEAGKFLGEIIESGARIVDGKIVKMSRSMGLSDFLDYSLKRLEDGSEIILPSFPDEAAKLNFLRKLNKRYQDAFSTTDDLFEVVVGAKGGTVLRIKGDASDLKEIIKQYGDEKLIRPIAGADDYVQFGEKALSKGARDLLLSQTQLIDDYKNLSDEILQELIDVAGFDNLPSALAGQIGYMRHVMSMEAYKGLQRQLPGVASLFARPGSDTLAQRTFLGSAEEINAAMREFMNLDMDLFDPNAFNAMEDLIKVAQRKLDQSRVLDIVLKGSAVEGESLMRVVANTQDARAAMSPYDRMFKSFKEEFSALYKNLSPEGQAQLDAYFNAAGYGADKAVVMNKSAYNVLKGAEKAYIEIPGLIKTYDKFLNTWKGVTLVSPGFHLRNMFGNMFNSYAIGMDTVAQSKYLGVAMTELDQFSKIGKKLAQGLDITPAEQKLFDTVRGYFEHGASQTHRGIRDLEQLKEATSAVAKGGKIKTGYNNLLKFNFNVAEKIDDVQRYALYRWSFDKTNDVNKAARTVSEALFDYSHLTPFEKKYMKRIFPFYTFMKNNFIFQAKNIFANPKQYARAGRAYNYAVEDLSGYSQDDLPDYATENMWLPLPITVNKNDKAGIAFLKANLPISDFIELVENPFSKGVTSLTAPVKLIIEFGAGRDLFTGAPLQAFPGQKNAMEAGTGVLPGLRDQRGNLTISQSPLFQKIINDIGLRTPVNFASAGLDLVDTLAGYQGPKEGLGDFMVRAGILGVQEADRMELTKLYQDLEKLRNLKKYYEQETGNQLPVLPR